jgi:hypothetical protein
MAFEAAPPCGCEKLRGTEKRATSPSRKDLRRRVRARCAGVSREQVKRQGARSYRLPIVVFGPHEGKQADLSTSHYIGAWAKRTEQRNTGPEVWLTCRPCICLCGYNTHPLRAQSVVRACLVDSWDTL